MSVKDIIMMRAVYEMKVSIWPYGRYFSGYGLSTRDT